MGYGMSSKKTIDELHHSEKDGFFKHQPDDHQLCINGLHEPLIHWDDSVFHGGVSLS